MQELQTAITTENLCKEYYGRAALSELNLKILSGEIHALLGHNGAGKSTTMKILAGLMPQTSGNSTILGRIGYLPEQPPLYLDMRVRDFLRFVGKIHNVPTATLRSKIEEVVATLSLDKFCDRLIGNLSKGQRQRIGVAMVLLYDPQIYILDEPTIGLDPASLVELRQVIKQLQQKQKTVLISTHQLSEVNHLCDSLTILQQGRALYSGAMQSLQEMFKFNAPIMQLTLREYRPEVQKQLLDNFKEIKKISYHKNGEHTEIRVVTNIDRPNLQDEIMGTLMHYNCGILSFTQESFTLEDIYLKMTKQNHL
ncbi:MAG: ABC transporter ATP-binding protein [Oligoflexia bacterium]|nr:ABC transporter ATP-binding protein [Oligoflexia bacterium]MBF0364927.1 ABC transporter ATP-binding protein [Oligoflexia bacterium]